MQRVKTCGGVQIGQYINLLLCPWRPAAALSSNDHILRAGCLHLLQVSYFPVVGGGTKTPPHKPNHFELTNVQASTYRDANEQTDSQSKIHTNMLHLP